MGKYITDINQLYDGLTYLFTNLNKVPAVHDVVLKSNIVIRLNYSDPDGVVILDASGDEIKVYTGACPDGVTPKVSLRLTSDLAHQYWLGKVNFMLAMQKGEIKTEGDLGVVLKLVPVLGPMFKIYADYCKEHGI